MFFVTQRQFREELGKLRSDLLEEIKGRRGPAGPQGEAGEAGERGRGMEHVLALAHAEYERRVAFLEKTIWAGLGASAGLAFAAKLIWK